jgi:hypothetical protein
MLSKTVAIVALVLVLAEQPSTSLQADTAWNAAYWNYTTLAGTPALQRIDFGLNHDWGSGSPPNIAPDRFSGRWTRDIDFSTDVYRFTATSDDGIRVWVDNDLIINEWYDDPAQTYQEERRSRLVAVDAVKWVPR